MTFESFEKTLHLIADVITILGVGGLVSFAALARDRNLLGRKVFKFLVWTFKCGLILAVIFLTWLVWMLPYGLLLTMLKGEASQFYWEDGKESQHIHRLLTDCMFHAPCMWLGSFVDCNRLIVLSETVLEQDNERLDQPCGILRFRHARDY